VLSDDAKPLNTQLFSDDDFSEYDDIVLPDETPSLVCQSPHLTSPVIITIRESPPRLMHLWYV
jgi:hypothetical protein